MSFGDYLKSIWRSWIAVVALTVVGGVAAFFISSSTPDTYRSTSAVLLTSDNGSSTSELVQGTAYVENLVSTYVILARSELVLSPVIRELDLDTSVSSLAATVSASSPLNSLVIELSIVNRSPVLAQEIADAVTRSLTRVVTEDVSPTTADGKPTIRLTTIQSATEARFPIAPNTRLDTLLGIVIGLALGVAYAVVRTLVWHAVHSAEDVAQVTSVPVVGEIVETKGEMTLPGSILTDPLGIEAESLRSFAANLNFLKVDGDLRSFVVTSASPAESKSSVVTALGVALAESSKRVLLVDADLRHPSLATLTQLEGSVGLTNVLIGEQTLDRAVQRWAFDGLDVLTAGAVPPNPGQLLASDAMRDFIRDAREQYDVVIVDSAPVLSVTDAKWLGNMTDGALIVTRYERTSTRALKKLMETMESGAVPLLGIVITRMPRRVRTRYGNARYGLEDAAPTR